MDIDITKTCCFTGHRPDKLLGSEEHIREALKERIEDAISNGTDAFISGMAEGVDIWAAEEVLKLKAGGEDIKLVCAVPFNGVERKRTAMQQETFCSILSEADDIVYVCQKYTPWCFSARNRWMVDHSSKAIAVFNGTSGGTEKTLDYAGHCGLEIVMIKDEEGDT